MFNKCPNPLVLKLFSSLSVPLPYIPPYASLPYGPIQKQSSQVTYKTSNGMYSSANIYQMARKKKHARKQTDLAAPANQPGSEPRAFQNPTLDVTPSGRRTSAEDIFHYPGTRRSRFQDQDQDRRNDSREAVSNDGRSRAPVPRELPGEDRTAESRKAVASTGHSRPLLSHGFPDQYRPGNTTRASWDTWRPRESGFREPHPIQSDYGPRPGLSDAQPAFLSPRYMPQPNQNGIYPPSLPKPSRTGWIEIRAPLQAGEGERLFLRTQPTITSNNGTSPTWRPEVTMPSYTPPSAVPLGVQRSSRIQPTNSFATYQPLRSVQITRKFPLWRIDEYYRFTHTANTRSAWAEDEEARILSQERWTGSVTQRTAQYPQRFDQVGSGIAQQRHSETPHPKNSNFRRDDRTLKPLPIPKPTAQYLQQANQPPRKSATLRPLLLVIDLNGTLVDRKRRTSSFVERPNLAPFIDYVLANHTLMIWSSAQPDTVRSVCQRLFSPAQRRQVIAEWARDTLDLTAAQYREKVQVYKRLEKIWRDDTMRDRHPDAEKGGLWDQSNTVLIDDSRLKGAAQPHNLLEIPEFQNRPEQRGTDVLAQVVGYLEELRVQDDVSRFMRLRSFRLDDGWARPWRGEVQVQSGQA